MAEKACHTFASTTQVGLTQALGCIETSAARPQLIYSTTTDSPDAAAFQAPPLSPCLAAQRLYSRRRPRKQFLFAGPKRPYPPVPGFGLVLPPPHHRPLSAVEPSRTADG